MNIQLSYSMLVGRLWIHSTRAIPLSLHQKVKCIINGKIVTINIKEFLLVTKDLLVPYIEASEEALKASFQSFEIVATNYIA